MGGGGVLRQRWVDEKSTGGLRRVVPAGRRAGGGQHGLGWLISLLVGFSD